MSLTLAWPVVVPDRLAGGMAAKIEAATTTAGRYPPEWPAVAWLVKTAAGWRCERCQAPHGPIPRVLTVHHLDEDKANLEHWNLAALCQRCHLQVQGRVNFYQLWPWPHTRWMAGHVADFNEWARRRGMPEMPLVGVVDRDPATYWPEALGAWIVAGSDHSRSWRVRRTRSRPDSPTSSAETAPRRRSGISGLRRRQEPRHPLPQLVQIDCRLAGAHHVVVLVVAGQPALPEPAEDRRPIPVDHRNEFVNGDELWLTLARRHCATQRTSLRQYRLSQGHGSTVPEPRR